MAAVEKPAVAEKPGVGEKPADTKAKPAAGKNKKKKPKHYAKNMKRN